MITDDKIRTFVKFLKEHGDQEMRYSNGLLQTPGCNDDYGCCSRSFYLDGLANGLAELIGES